MGCLYPGRRARGLALCPGLLSVALAGLSVSGFADSIVDLKSLEDLIANPPLQRKVGVADTKAFCDFAWGGKDDNDENVLALRDGNIITIEETFRADKDEFRDGS